MGAFVPSGMTDTAASVVLARLDGGDEGRLATDHLARVFGEVQDLAIYRRSQSIALNHKIQLFDALQAASDEGVKWLAQDEADVLIWGEIIDLGASVTLRFQPKAGTFANVFGPADHLTLPLPFPKELDCLILASSLGALLPVHGGSGKKLAEVLEREMKRLARVLENPPELEPSHLASALVCYGNAALALWGAGGGGYLDAALKAYQQASETIGRRDDVLLWSLAANHHAHALQAKGDRDSDDDALGRAVAAYRDVADTLGRSAYRNEWAMARVNMGMALFKLGNKETSVAKLKASVEAFEEAIGVFDRETHPGKHAEVMTQYGAVLLALGERVQGERVLEKAIGVFRRALAVRQRDIVPILWAQTANNLGAACFALAKRAPGEALVAEAEKNFKEAAEVFRKAGHGRRAAVIQKNLQRIKDLRKSGKSGKSGRREVPGRF